MADLRTKNLPAKTRMIGLDLLRLLAIFMVMGRHSEVCPTDTPLKSVWDSWHRNGWVGVELFFVLSGFLVSGLLFAEYKKHGDISVKRFYMRRALKIYPAFYFLTAFAYLYQLLVMHEKIRDHYIFSELLFLQSYREGFWNHTWTLAVEEHFYFIMPLLLLYLARRNRGAANPFGAIPYLVAGTAVLLLSIRIANSLLREQYSYYTHAFPTHLRIDALFFGVAIAYAYHFYGDWFRRAFTPLRYLMIVFGAAVLEADHFFPPFSQFYSHTFGFAQHYLGAAALLVGVLMCDIPRNRLTVSLAALGAYSYSIYLWHMALMYWAVPHLRALSISWELRTAFYMLGALVIGVAMAKLLEVPGLRFRDRKFPSRSADVGATPPAAVVNSVEVMPSRRAA